MPSFSSAVTDILFSHPRNLEYCVVFHQNSYIRTYLENLNLSFCLKNICLEDRKYYHAVLSIVFFNTVNKIFEEREEFSVKKIEEIEHRTKKGNYLFRSNLHMQNICSNVCVQHFCLHYLFGKIN